MKEYKTITEISGPLVFAEVDEPVGYDEIVEIETPDGSVRRGQVLESTADYVAIQVFEGTDGINRDSSVRFLGETLQMKLTEELLGRVLDGSGQPIDGGPPIEPDERREIVGAAINPTAREYPEARSCRSSPGRGCPTTTWRCRSPARRPSPRRRPRARARSSR
jgi:V/A-type H+-transporting ATPase subunit B